MDDNSFTFTAIQGTQAGAAYYVIMVPLKVVPRLFKFDDESMPTELRAQRVLNKARVPTIAAYIANNAEEYILSSLCASIDGGMEFEPVASTGPLRKVGQLKVDMGAVILINDGQHRRAAIEEAVRDRPSLGDETLSVVVFPDKGLARSQQMFADLNIHAVRPTRSIKLLYDHRDDAAALSRKVVDAVPLFREFTCFDTASLSNRSIKLVTFSSVHQATAELIAGAVPAMKSPEEALDRAARFWSAVIAQMPDWQRVQTREVASGELRKNYVHAHGVALQAIARAGVQLIATHPDDWEARLGGLRRIDWSRSNKAVWDNRALVGGKVNRATNNVTLVANIIVQALDLPLSPDAARVEAMVAPIPVRAEAV
ncbi:DNA sulfur modification protein DndB [Brevundimonas goettingensis]|uniref:DNA sulfur modification protein DndB n=1 Tax=Brevundimonas goettingensis TaxID=2774190 RepID=A0A975GXA4_9CAUL|nr:DNA sulfur modification protein DndB [Brevundimonas goettingensis]QTC90325.1 DNA sulfur modification protein DndB [Brevundimonas goettingensis]